MSSDAGMRARERAARMVGDAIALRALSVSRARRTGDRFPCAGCERETELTPAGDALCSWCVCSTCQGQPGGCLDCVR